MKDDIFFKGADADQIFKETLEEAQKNHPKAQYRLALLYENGCYVNKSQKKALKWYLAAAENDFAGAQFMVGHYFEYGQGTAKNLNDAIIWYKLAAKNGHAYAKNKLIDIMSKDN